MLEGLLVGLHVFSNLVWIGSIASVGWLTAQAWGLGESEGARAYGAAALDLYRRFATPAFVFSFVFGVSRVLMDPKGYMHLHWFHGKLTFALLVIALHHILGARAKKVAQRAPGSMQGANNSAILTIALLICPFLINHFLV